jgi:hypothetical protein
MFWGDAWMEMLHLQYEVEGATLGRLRMGSLYTRFRNVLRHS